MGKTGISYLDKVWNPVTGCTKVSAGCAHCWAEAQERRFHGGFDVTLHPDRLDPTSSREHPEHWKKPVRIGVCFMGDLFHEDVPFDFIFRVFGVMYGNPDHTFMVLTKRPERMAEFARWLLEKRDERGLSIYQWPPNVEAWTSIEDQASADERIPHLLRVVGPRVRGVSAEPMLGPVDLRWPMPFESPVPGEIWKPGAIDKINGVIVGCESGPGARPMDITWVRSLRNQCQAAGVAFYFKQAMVDGKLVTHPLLDGREWKELPK